MTTRRTSDSRETREQEALHRVDPATAQGGGIEGSAIATAATVTWDPYEVWLTRVKRPRDETVRMRKKLSARATGPGADANAAGTSSSSETSSQTSAKPSTA